MDLMADGPGFLIVIQNGTGSEILTFALEICPEIATGAGFCAGVCALNSDDNNTNSAPNATAQLRSFLIFQSGVFIGRPGGEWQGFYIVMEFWARMQKRNYPAN